MYVTTIGGKGDCVKIAYPDDISPEHVAKMDDKRQLKYRSLKFEDFDGKEKLQNEAKRAKEAVQTKRLAFARAQSLKLLAMIDAARKPQT